MPIMASATNTSSRNLRSQPGDAQWVRCTAEWSGASVVLSGDCERFTWWASTRSDHLPTQDALFPPPRSLRSCKICLDPLHAEIYREGEYMGSCLHCAVVDDMMDITHPAETAKEMHNDKRSDVQQCCFTGQSMHGERPSCIVASFWGLHDECREVLTMPHRVGAF